MQGESAVGGSMLAFASVTALHQDSTDRSQQ
jgi:hypothetical protein